MTDQYSKCNQMMLEGMTDATSLQALVCGSTLCSLQGGKITPFGQAVAPASLLVQQVDKKVKQTIGTYGLNGSASLKSASLQQSLENKLQALLPTGGLTMFIKGWKRKTTPSGRLYCHLAVSVRPIKEIDCGLWPTPQARDYRSGQGQRFTNQERSNDLNDAAALWATPNTMDHLPPRSKEAMERQFSTTRKGRTAPANLREQVIPAMWPTPNASDHRDRGSYSDPCIQRRIAKGKQVGLTMIAQGAGKMGNGSTAQTGSKGSLNPAFPCWLMGIPKGWESSIVQGMQSYRKSPQTSYKPVYRENN